MNLSLSVAVAIALGTPGIGNVTTGLLPSHATEFFPAFETSAGTRCGRGAISGGSLIPAIAALNAPCGPAHRRIIRSSTVAGFCLAFTGDEFGAGNVFVPGIRSTEDLDIGARLAIGPGAGVLNPLPGSLVADAGSILRDIAGLSVHLKSALALVFERHDQVSLLAAAEHAHIPGPVEKDCFQV